MPVDFSWGDAEMTILIQRYQGSVGVADYISAVHETNHWLKQVTHPVDLILDLTQAHINWGGLFSGAAYADQRVPENQRLIVIVGANSFVRGVVELLRRVAPRANRNQHFALSVRDAVTLIQNEREKSVSGILHPG